LPDCSDDKSPRKSTGTGRGPATGSTWRALWSGGLFDAMFIADELAPYNNHKGSSLLPGPEAQQLATYVGWLLHKIWGGIAAGAFFIIPSIFILWALSYTYVAISTISS